MASGLATRFVCSGCAHVMEAFEAKPFVCPHRGDGGDHVLVRRFADAGQHAELLNTALADSETQPFVRFRRLFHGWHFAMAKGMADAEYVDRVHALDQRIAEVDGRGFIETPLCEESQLAEALGRPAGSLLIKNESGNVSGSHKARHLMHVAIWLQTTAALGLAQADDEAPLAIASCGNAALAAAVVARALGRKLLVFVPVDAPPAVLERMRELQAEIRVCEREATRSGDPCIHAFHDAVRNGALPFGCQGPENGLTVEGGLTLGYELLSQLRSLGHGVDHIVVQVGGGALGSGIFHAFLEAQALELLNAGMPHLHTVQTQGAHPLRRALQRVSSLSQLPRAARERTDYMWPWESTPQSYATGILDDETYDWLALVDAMLRTGGTAIVSDEATLREAHALGRRMTGIDVCATGASGLAGLMTLQREETVDAASSALLIFSGVQR